MANTNSVSRQKEQNRWLIYEPVSCFQPSTSPDSIPLLKSRICRRPSGACAISSITRWLESVSGSELGSHKERRPSPGFTHEHSSLSYSGKKFVYRKIINTALGEEDIQDTRVLISSPTESDLNGRHYDYDYNSDCYPGTRSASLDDGSILSTMLSGQALVEESEYRLNLKYNGIDLLPSYNHLSEHVCNFISHVWEYNAPAGLSPNQILSDTRLADLRMGAAEVEVAAYFQRQLFLIPGQRDALRCSIKMPMARHAVPGVDSKMRVSIPVPDILYGYNSFGAFTDTELGCITTMVTSPVSGNRDLLMFPFLAIEQKGDGPVSRGSLWVATNQCLGAAASCTNIIERFSQLPGMSNCSDSNRYDNKDRSNDDNIDVKPINGFSFSIAMNGSEARLYVTWKHEGVKYHTAIVDSFLLQRPTDFLNFRRYVLNILDWGMGERLTAIRTSLGKLLKKNKKIEEGKKRTLRRDMDRSSPSKEQDGGRARKRRRGYRRRDVGDTGSSIDFLVL